MTLVRGNKGKVRKSQLAMTRNPGAIFALPIRCKPPKLVSGKMLEGKMKRRRKQFGPNNIIKKNVP